jgi:cytochrome c oxidase cbb3-type subunit 4
MDTVVFQGAMLIVMMASFFGLWIWAWSHKRKATFKQASMLPLEEDDGEIPGLENEKD